MTAKGKLKKPQILFLVYIKNNKMGGEAMTHLLGGNRFEERSVYDDEYIDEYEEEMEELSPLDDDYIPEEYRTEEL